MGSSRPTQGKKLRRETTRAAKVRQRVEKEQMVVVVGRLGAARVHADGRNE